MKVFQLHRATIVDLSAYRAQRESSAPPLGVKRRHQFRGGTCMAPHARPGQVWEDTGPSPRDTAA